MAVRCVTQFWMTLHLEGKGWDLLFYRHQLVQTFYTELSVIISTSSTFNWLKIIKSDDHVPSRESFLGWAFLAVKILKRS
jgi:hypothetical protein